VTDSLVACSVELLSAARRVARLGEVQGGGLHVLPLPHLRQQLLDSILVVVGVHVFGFLLVLACCFFSLLRRGPYCAMRYSFGCTLGSDNQYQSLGRGGIHSTQDKNRMRNSPLGFGEGRGDLEIHTKFGELDVHTPNSSPASGLRD
jgi:hypothetical protein